MDRPHVAVLVTEAIRLLAPRPGLFVDATVGAGGHAEALLESDAELQLLAIDRDPRAIEICRERLSRFSGRVEFFRGNFDELDAALAGRRERPAGILADLGVSSMQLDVAARGFSFRRDGPLDMRMGEGSRTAAEIVNGAPTAELKRIFREYGEERMAEKIARRITEEREKTPITTTRQLAALVAGVVRHGGDIDPATRVFQALRIEVNQELASLARFLKTAADKLDLRGRIAVLSYHSLEDRIVKEEFRRLSTGCICPPAIPVCVCGGRQAFKILTRKPVRPSDNELHANPRSRSARLRGAEKIAEIS